MADEDKPPLMFPINLPYLRRLEAWLWTHPKSAVALTLLSVALISSPTWFSDVWALFSNEAPFPKMMNWLSGLPDIYVSWYWLPVGLGFVMLAVITSLLWRGRKRLEAEVASARTAKPEQPPPSEPPQCPYDLVHRIADHQAKNIRDFVYVSRVGVWEDKLNDPVPTIKWGFLIENKSLFPITLVEVRNNLFFETTELAERRFESHNEVEQVGYWRDGSVIFEQRLSGPEAQYIKSKPNGKFRFNRLKIKVGNPNSHPIIEPQELIVSDDLETEINVLTYKETEGMKSLRKERDWLKDELQRTKDADAKLTFEIDGASQVNTTGGGTEGRRIQASVKLRCMKTAEHPMAIIDFHAALLKQSDNEQVIVPQESKRAVMTYPDMKDVDVSNGWTINEQLSGFRWFMFYLDITPQQLQLLSPDYFIRITMIAVGQKPLSIDFDVNNWEDARKSNSDITIRGKAA